MGHCISDTTIKDEFFDVKKQFNDENFQEEPQFYKKQMNQNVIPTVEKQRQAAFSDGLGKQDNSRSIITISYW